MISILVVSHSYKLAKAAVEFVAELQTEDFIIYPVGGINDGETFGTDPIVIREKLKEIDQGNGVVVICDIGSSFINSELAITLLEQDQQNKIKIARVPFLEGLIMAVTNNRANISLTEFLKLIDESKEFRK